MAITLMFVWKTLSESHDHQNNSALGMYCIAVTLKYPVYNSYTKYSDQAHSVYNSYTKYSHQTYTRCNSYP